MNTIKHTFLALLCFAGFNFSIFSAEKAVVSGVVTKGDADLILLIYNENVPNLVFQHTKKALLDEEGAFTIEVGLPHAFPASLRYEGIDYPIFMRSNSQVKVEINALQGTFEIIGGVGSDDAKAYQFMRENFPRLDYPLQWTLDQQVKNPAIQPSEIEEKAGLRQRQQSLLLNRLQNNLKLSKSYVTYEKNTIFYGTAYAKYSFLKHFARQNPVQYGEAWKSVHHTYLDSLKQVYPIESPFENALDTRNYTQYLQAFLDYHYETYPKPKAGAAKVFEWDTRWMLAQRHFPASLQDYVLFTVVTDKYFNNSEEYDYLPKELFDTYVQNFKDFSSNEKYEKLLDYERKARYTPAALKGITDSPNGLVEFNTVKVKRTSLETFKQFLKDHKGKVIFVEFWSTKATPALEELPTAQEFIESYRGKDIEFLFIALDDDDFKWREILRRYPLGQSYQLIVPGGIRSTLARNYGVIRLPRYLLIDKRGNLILEEAPSFLEFGQLKPQIDELLEK